MFFWLFLGSKLFSDMSHIFLSQAISQWIMDQPPLGNKSPRPGFARQRLCTTSGALFYLKPGGALSVEASWNTQWL